MTTPKTDRKGGQGETNIKRSESLLLRGWGVVWLKEEGESAECKSRSGMARTQIRSRVTTLGLLVGFGGGMKADGKTGASWGLGEIRGRRGNSGVLFGGRKQ